MQSKLLQVGTFGKQKMCATGVNHLQKCVNKEFVLGKQGFIKVAVSRAVRIHLRVSTQTFDCTRLRVAIPGQLLKREEMYF